MAFSEQFLDEVRERTGLAALIGRRVRLQQRGREHVGLCPFHNEKSPSFTVNEEKGFYHCFGCGVHGSALDFVMATEGLSFPDAVARLAADAGLEVPRDSPEEAARAQRQRTLFDVLEAATRFYESRLQMPDGAQARDYLAQRGVSAAAIKQFRLGLSPRTGGVLRDHLMREGISEDDLIAAGLVRRPDDGRTAYDWFRGRLMFPIADRRGRIIAFGARTLENAEPKYLNSPETALFSKCHLLYGLNHAQAAARTKGRILVVEGYMDVIALADAGFAEAVAPLGTALTEGQLKLLWAIVPEPVLAFDGDAAGARAGARALERALPELKAGTGLNLAFLPAGEDPDSLLKNRGASALETVLAQAVPLSEALWRTEAGSRPPASPEGRAALEARLKQRIARIQDGDVRAHFLNDLRERLRQLSRAGGGWAAGGRGAKGGSRGRGAKGGAWSGGASSGGMWSGGAWSRNAGPRPDGGAALGGAGVAGGASGGSQPAGANEGPRRLHEAILLATALNHPALLETVSERLGTVVFGDPALDRLRQEVAAWAVGGTLEEPETLDSEAIRRHFRDSGQNEAVEQVLGLRVYEHAFFARPEASLADARDGWEETFALYRRVALDADLQAARRRLAEGGDERALEALRALKAEQHAQAENTGAESAAVGAGAGPKASRR